MKYFKLNDMKCKCGNDEFFFRHKKMHIGAYCSKCGRWLKWVNNSEQNISDLFFEQFNK
jgi:hypothetical protein